MQSEKLDKAEQPDLPGRPLTPLSVELSPVPGRHEAVGAAIDPDILEPGHLAVEALEREVIARQLVAGMQHLALSASSSCISSILARSSASRIALVSRKESGKVRRE